VVSILCVRSISVLCRVPAEADFSWRLRLDKVQVPRPVNRCSHDWSSRDIIAGSWRRLRHHISQRIRTV